MLDLSYLLIISAGAGVAFHLATLSQELDYQSYRLFGSYVLAISGLSYTLFQSTHDVLAAVKTTGVMAAVFNTALAASILTYRLFFHRLHKFPGPTLAKASSWWFFFKAAEKTQGHLLIESLHKQYGDWVRIGPREISTTVAAAVPALYSSTTRCKKSVFYNYSGPDSEGSIFATRSKKVHSARRKAWDRAFNGAALADYEPELSQLVSTTIAQMRSLNGKPTDAAAWGRWFAFDAMGKLGFGKNFGMIDKMKMHPVVQQLIEAEWHFGVTLHLPWLLRILMSFPATALKPFQDWVDSQLVEAQKRMDSGEKSDGTIISTLLKASKDLSDNAKNQDCRVVIVAGSDTTASAIAGFFYYLALYPAVYKKLQHTLDGHFPGGDAEYTNAVGSRIPYLDAVIHETLRLQPPVPVGLPRETPPEGLTIDGVFIPGCTTISVPNYTINRDERYYGSPLEFIPERWTEERADLAKNKNVFMPFTLGTYTCAGKPMAYMQMRMLLARIALNFDLEFVEDGTKKRYPEEHLDYFTLQLPPLSVKFLPRKRET